MIAPPKKNGKMYAIFRPPLSNNIAVNYTKNSDTVNKLYINHLVKVKPKSQT